MPYRISLESIEPFRAALDEIYKNATENKTTIISTNFPTPTSWGIRQAIASAIALNIEPFNELRVRCRVSQDPPAVIIYPKFVPKDYKLVISSAPQHGAKVMHGVSGMRGVVEASLNSKIKETVLSFPDLEPSLLPTALNWAKTLGHEVTSEHPFTIRRKRREAGS